MGNSEIVSTILQYITLGKVGRKYRGLCPFHTEKTPSLLVDPERQIFQCFGCGASGDVSDFVRRMENLE